MWFCEQYLAWSCPAGLPPTRFYAGLARRFVGGFVSNLLRFPPGGGRQLGYAGLACRFVYGFVRNLLRFLPGGGATNLVTPAWRAVP